MSDTTATTATTATSSAIDLRQIAPRDRHSLIFNRVDQLQPGQSLQLLNDHDPQPLRRQLEQGGRGRFEWTALESGPQVWRVQITRVGAGPIAVAADSCCSGGACCG